jgi:hypothetical protein
MMSSLVLVGGCWLVLITPPWAIDGVEDAVYFLVIATYVVAGGLWMSALYARESVTLKQEVLALVALWLIAVAMWTAAWYRLGITAESDPDTAYLVNGASLPEDVGLGLWLATPCFAAWQLPALAIRAAWRRWAAPARRTPNVDPEPR